ncbi:hypothetical protein SDC9_21348 [bioreactor metagenome]|uniref:NAD-specific glutamate dehydrogenase n=1 Tax=bioreactor metagenome TaxID=1076179 RepID=A0A644U9A3_9ZZZZ
MVRALAAEAGLLDAAEGRDLGRDDAGVHPDDAVFEAFLHAGDAADVAGVEIRGQTEDRGIRLLDHLFLGVEPEQRCDRAEGFLGGDLHLLRHAGDDGRLEEGAAKRVALAAGDDGAAALDHVGDVILDLGHGLVRDQRAGGDAGLETVADVQLGDRGGQLLGEGVIDPGLHIDAVRADAGLAVVAELRHHRALDRGVEIGVVEDDEGRVAAKLHRAFHHLIGGLTHQDPADLGRAGEGQLTHRVVLAELLADVRGPGRGDDREDPLRQAGALAQNRERQRRQRGLGGRARDEAAAHRKGRAAFAGDHRIREVPRRDRTDNTDRLLDHLDALVAHVARDGLAIDALGLLAEPLDERGAIGDLALRLGQRLAHLGGEDRAEVVLVRHHQLEPLAQHVGAFLGGARGPFLHRDAGGLDRAGGLGAAEIGHGADHVAAGGVGHREGGAVIGVDPFAGHIGLGGKKGGVLEKGFEIGGGVEHGYLPVLGVAARKHAGPALVHPSQWQPAPAQVTDLRGLSANMAHGAAAERAQPKRAVQLGCRSPGIAVAV